MSVFRKVMNNNVIIGISSVAIVLAVIVISHQEFLPFSSSTLPPEHKTFYITTVHFDGITSINGTADHPPEPFPNSALPSGGGYILKKLDDKGNWKARTFAFVPSQIVVHQGDEVTLKIVDIQGDHHHITIEGIAPEFEIHRGELKTITFTADKIGTIHFYCSVHQPAMSGQILVLPRTVR